MTTENPGVKLLEARDLRVSLPTASGLAKPVRGVDLTLGHGERVALVGESGAGKSVTLRGLIRLDRDARYSGQVLYSGKNLLAMKERDLVGWRGKKIGFVPQDPLDSLDPLRPIGKQLADVGLCNGLSRRESLDRALTWLESFGFQGARTRLGDRPHQFSGGQLQRVAIAMALLPEPDVVLADEPTTALDVRLQAAILDLLWNASETHGVAIALVTHNLGVAAGFAHRILVMYAGRIVESATAEDLFSNPMHPYTQRLIAAVPRMGERLRVAADRDIASPPSPMADITGCAYRDRCPISGPVCAELTPEPLEVDLEQYCACHMVHRSETTK